MTQSSDEDAFRAFVMARTPALSRTAYLLTGDAHLAEDLVRTALLEAARSWHRIRDDPEPSVRRILATQNVGRHVPEPASAEQALARLTARERTVLVLRYYEDLTEVEVADVLGTAPRTVRSTGRQALDRIGMPEAGLRDELFRIGETAPVADVPDDTWARARSSLRRNRTRAVAGATWARARTTVRRDPTRAVAGAAAAVALVVGLGAWLTAGPAAPAGAVPDHVHNVPAGALEHLETDLAVGRGSVAFVAPGGVPVVVGAEKSDYHPLDLPGFTGGDEASPLGLSPDGRQLAYASADRVRSGVRVVDLGSGEVREIPVEDGTLVHWFRWSEDSRWLVWGGRRPQVGTVVAGLIAPGATSFDYLPTLPDDAHVSYAVSSMGTVAVIGDSIMMVLRSGRTSRTALDVGATSSVEASFSGETLSDIRVSVSGDGYWLFRNTDRLPLAEVPAGSVVIPLGRLDDTHQLARITRGDPAASDLAVVGVGDDAELDVVGTIDAGVPPISVATGLSSVEHPTTELSAPHWPWTVRGLVTLGAGIVLLASAVVLLLTRRRRVSSALGEVGQLGADRPLGGSPE